MNQRIIITNSVSKAFIYTEEQIEQNEFSKFVGCYDESTTIASLNAVIDVLENIDEDDRYPYTIYVPLCLKLMIELDQPEKIRNNGYKTDKGASLTEEFVDLMCYANQLRDYLREVKIGKITLIPHNDKSLDYEEIELINKAWSMTNKINK